MVKSIEPNVLLFFNVNKFLVEFFGMTFFWNNDYTAIITNCNRAIILGLMLLLENGIQIVFRLGIKTSDRSKSCTPDRIILTNQSRSITERSIADNCRRLTI